MKMTKTIIITRNQQEFLRNLTKNIEAHKGSNLTPQNAICYVTPRIYTLIANLYINQHIKTCKQAPF